MDQGETLLVQGQLVRDLPSAADWHFMRVILACGLRDAGRQRKGEAQRLIDRWQQVIQRGFNLLGDVPVVGLSCHGEYLSYSPSDSWLLNSVPKHLDDRTYDNLLSQSIY